MVYRLWFSHFIPWNNVPLLSTSFNYSVSQFPYKTSREGVLIFSPYPAYNSSVGGRGASQFPPPFFPYVAKRIPDSVGYIQFEPCHVCAIFTQWFTFSKDNHGENICRQLSGCSTIWSSSNLIFFFIYFMNVNHVFKAKNEPAGLRRMIGGGWKGWAKRDGNS